MEKGENAQRTLQVTYFRISARYLNVMRLMDLHSVMRVMAGRGYQPLGTLPPPAFGAKVGAAGPIARKGTLLVDADTEKQVIGLSSTDIGATLEEFPKVEDALRGELTLELRPFFYEAQAEFEVTTGQEPSKVMENVGRQLSLLEGLSRRTNMKLCLFGLRLRRAGTEVDSPNWTDITVHQAFWSRMKYYVMVVHREPELQSVMEFAKGLEDFVMGLIDKLEEAVVS